MIGPKHVAIIMDGNGRWGKKKKNSRRRCMMIYNYTMISISLVYKDII